MALVRHSSSLHKLHVHVCRREILERDLNRSKEQKSTKVPPGGFSTKEDKSNKDDSAYSNKYKGTRFKTRFDFSEPNDFSW